MYLKKISILVVVLGFITMNAFGEDLYVLENGVSNRVLHFTPDSSGNLSLSTATETGEQGTGSPLGTQGAQAATPDGRCVFVVNAGNNTVSAFQRSFDGSLNRVDVDGSRGIEPNTLAANDNFLTVANKGDNVTVTTTRLFSVSERCRMKKLPKQDVSLEISFNPGHIIFTDENRVVVSGKNVNQLAVIDLPRAVNRRSMEPRTTILSTTDGLDGKGSEPFAFDFDPALKVLFVANAEQPGSDSSVSAYKVSATGLTFMRNVVMPGLSAACWIDLDPELRTFVLGNTGGPTVSSHRYGADLLGLVFPVASPVISNITTIASRPFDVAIGVEHAFVLVGNGVESMPYDRETAELGGPDPCGGSPNQCHGDHPREVSETRIISQTSVPGGLPAAVPRAPGTATSLTTVAGTASHPAGLTGFPRRPSPIASLGERPSRSCRVTT